MNTPFSVIHPARDREIHRLLDTVSCPSPARTGELLEMSRERPLGLGELAELLEIGKASEAGEQFALLRRFVLVRWRNPRDNRVRYVSPIYVSSFCVDTCAYCNFSALRKSAVRKRLTAEELGAEIREVIAAGARVIELVYGTDPECGLDRLVNDVTQVARALGKEPGSGVLLCTEYLPREAYDALHAAGLWGIVQWDETLEPGAYHRWHAASPRKREFIARMDNHDRAMAAGLTVATGALFGLADWRYDVLMQVAKARHFAAEYGRAPFVFGTARLKPIAGRELRFDTDVSDRAYETAIMVYRIAEPSAGRWLQTRESFQMNLRNLLDGDVFTYRCGDVKPGGYQQPVSLPLSFKGGQFGVNELERATVEAELAARNFRMVYPWVDRRAPQPSRAATTLGIPAKSGTTCTSLQDNNRPAT